MTQDTTENDIKEKLGNKCGWTGTGNERTLTISGVNVTKSNSEGIAIEVAESIFLTIKVEGTSNLIESKDDTTMFRWAINSHNDIKITGNGKDSSKLTLNGGDDANNGLSGGIGCEGKITIEDVTLESSGGKGANSYGLCTDSAIVVKNSNVTCIGGAIKPGNYYSAGCCMDDCLNSSITDSVFKSTGAYYGMIMYGGNHITVENSDVTITCTNDDGRAFNRNFTDVSSYVKVDDILGKKSLDGEYSEITGDTIGAEYKAVRFMMLEEHTVKYSIGEGQGTAPEDQKVKETKKFTVSGCSATKGELVVVGWTDGTNDYTIGQSVTMGTEDINLTAIYGEVPSYAVTYDLNGGTGTAPTQEPVKKGSSFVVKGTDATKEGAEFGGWTIVGDTTGKIYQEGDTVVMGDSPIVFKAVWNAEPEPTPSGGNNIENLPLAIIVFLVILALVAIAYFGKD